MNNMNIPKIGTVRLLGRLDLQALLKDAIVALHMAHDFAVLADAEVVGSPISRDVGESDGHLRMEVVSTGTCMAPSLVLLTIIKTNTTLLVTGQHRWSDLAEGASPRLLLDIVVYPHAEVAVRRVRPDDVADAVSVPVLG